MRPVELRSLGRNPTEFFIGVVQHVTKETAENYLDGMLTTILVVKRLMSAPSWLSSNAAKFLLACYIINDVVKCGRLVDI